MIVNLACGHKAVFADEYANRHGLPHNWYCHICRKTREVKNGTPT